MKCSSYVASAVQTIKDFLFEDDKELKSVKRPHKGPLTHEYTTKLDVIDECDSKNVSWCQQLIYILRWAV